MFKKKGKILKTSSQLEQVNLNEEATLVEPKQSKKSKKQKAKKTNNQSTQRSIHYRAMYENGICEISPGNYSKTILFGDINYRVTKQETQVGIFSALCEAYNYYDSSMQVQINLRNRHVNPVEYNKSLLLDFANNNLDKYRKEYNNMINEKIMQGQNGILHEKHLTISYKADNFDKAIAIGARIEADTCEKLKQLGSTYSVLSGQARVELLHSYFSEEPCRWTYKNLIVPGQTTKDAIAPDTFNFRAVKNFMFTNNGATKYCQVLCLKQLPPDLSDVLLEELSTIACDMTISLNIHPMEQATALKLVKNQIAKMEMQRVDVVKMNVKNNLPTDLMPMELQYSMDEARELLDDLQNKSQRLFQLTFLIYTCADNEETLADNVMQIIGTARKKSVEISLLEERQELGFNSILPIGQNEIDIKRTLTTASTAIFMPFSSQELLQKNGVCYGLNALSHKLLMVDRKKLMNANGFILGTSGSGKSFKAKEEMISVLLRYVNDELIVIDPQGEYAPLATAFGGEVVKISADSTTFLNPLDINIENCGDEDPLHKKFDFIVAMLELVSHAELDGKDRSIIDRATKLTYEKYFKNPIPKNMPTLRDFYTVLISQPEDEARTLSLSLELFVQGSLSVFANQTTVNVKNRFIVFDIHTLGKQLTALGMLVVLEQLQNRTMDNFANGLNTWIYADEFHLLLKQPAVADYFMAFYKIARKFGGIPTSMTQNIEEVLLNDNARLMLGNAEFLILLNQAASDRGQLAHLLQMSAEQLAYVTNSPEGHGLLKASGAIIPFIDKFPKDTELYKLITTKMDDLKTIKAQQGEMV